MPPDEASSVLIPLFGDKDEFVRREAAYAAGEAGHDLASAGIVRLLQRDKSLEVKAAAAVALGKIGDPTALDSLTATLRARPTEDNEFIRRAAARSLGQIAQMMLTGRSKVITPQNFLPDKFKDLGTDVRPEAIGRVQTTFTSATEILMRLLKSSDESDDTRREAAFSLGAIGDRNAVSVLQNYTSSPDPYLAEICREALLKIGRLHGA
jgi:HEAT repeat protein